MEPSFLLFRIYIYLIIFFFFFGDCLSNTIILIYLLLVNYSLYKFSGIERGTYIWIFDSKSNLIDRETLTKILRFLLIFLFFYLGGGGGEEERGRGTKSILLTGKWNHSHNNIRDGAIHKIMGSADPPNL